MQRSQPYGEYRAGTDTFAVITPTGDLPAGPDDWIVRCADRFLPGPDRVFTAITTGAEVPEPSLCSECCDPVPPAELYPIPVGRPALHVLPARIPAPARGPRTHQLSWTETPPIGTPGGTAMTTLVYPAARHENMTASEHRFISS
jgi:hypothetical protein